MPAPTSARTAATSATGRRLERGTRAGSSCTGVAMSRVGASSSSSAWRRPLTSAPALGGRASGLLARARRSTVSTAAGRLGSTSDGWGGGSEAWSIASAVGESASNGRRPVSSSKATQPSAYRSLASVAGSPRACSGAMYPELPRIVPADVRGSCAAARAMPKSVTCTSLSSSSMRLAGFTSRWTMPAACAASSAPAAWSSQAIAVACGTRPPRSRSASDPPPRCSMTMNGVPSGSPTSKIVTTLGWEREAAVSASRVKRARKSSSAA